MPDAPKPSPVPLESIQMARIDRRSRVPYLEQVVGRDGTTGFFQLAKPEMSIGSQDAADVKLDPAVCRSGQVVLKARERAFLVLDNGVKGGLFLNGIRIHSAILREGDVVQVGTAVFVYHEG